MSLKKCLAFVFLTSVLGVLYAYTTDERYPAIPSLINSNEVEFIPPKKIMLKYYEAVDRGELVVFGIRLDRAMLIPVHVDYVYLVNGQTARVKVYAKLKKPLQIPEQDNNKFTAVCAVIDIFGKIIETEAHIILK